MVALPLYAVATAALAMNYLLTNPGYSLRTDLSLRRRVATMREVVVYFLLAQDITFLLVTLSCSIVSAARELEGNHFSALWWLTEELIMSVTLNMFPMVATIWLVNHFCFTPFSSFILMTLLPA